MGITPDVLWLNCYKFMIPYFVIAFYYAKYGKEWLKNKYVGIISVLLWIVLMKFYSKDMYIYTTGVTIIGKTSVCSQLKIDIYRFVVGVFGIIAILFVTKMFYEKVNIIKNTYWERILGIIEYMGINSIVFYILSTYLFTWVLPVVTSKFTLNYGVTFLETVVMIVVCAMISMGLKQSKILSRLIIGK